MNRLEFGEPFDQDGIISLFPSLARTAQLTGIPGMERLVRHIEYGLLTAERYACFDHLTDHVSVNPSFFLNAWIAIA